MPTPTAAYKWTENNACTATYKVLEHDNFLNQFEDADVPFPKAGDLKMKALRYYPKTTNNPHILELLSIELARKFLTFVIKIYTVSKEKNDKSSAETLRELAAIFADGNKTLKDLASVADENIRFPDEG